jgi:hypothetical protein
MTRLRRLHTPAAPPYLPLPRPPLVFGRTNVRVEPKGNSNQLQPHSTQLNSTQLNSTQYQLNITYSFRRRVIIVIVIVCTVVQCSTVRYSVVQYTQLQLHPTTLLPAARNRMEAPPDGFELSEYKTLGPE